MLIGEHRVANRAILRCEPTGYLQALGGGRRILHPSQASNQQLGFAAQAVPGEEETTGAAVQVQAVIRVRKL